MLGKISLFPLNFVTGKSAYFSLFYCLENQLNSARFLDRKISLFHLIFWQQNQLISAGFLAGKSAEFQSFPWLENVLNFELKKSTEFNSFYCLENQLNSASSIANLKKDSARFLGWKISLFHLSFMAGKST